MNLSPGTARRAPGKGAGALLLLVLSAAASGQATTPADAAAKVRQRFGTCDALVEREGALSLKSPKGAFFAVTGYLETEKEPLIDTGSGVVVVQADLLDDGRLAALDVLPALLERARAAGVPTEGLRLRDVPLIGAHLSSGAHWILPEGVAAKSVPAAGGGREAITTAAAAVAGALARSGLTSLGRKAVSGVVAMLGQDTSDDDNLTPEFARRLVRHGWMDAILPGSESEALTAAVRAADALRPATVYAGEGIRIVELEDAFEDGGWALRTPLRSGYAVTLPAAAWHPDPPALALVVELVPGSDPEPAATSASVPLAKATVFDGARAVSWWSPDGGFGCDEPAWTALRRRGVRGTTDLHPEFLPPHVLVAGLDGDLRLLATAHGTVAPPRDASPAESDRFLGEAAKALPDAAHLDLAGEYLFAYVMDSPDTRHPELVGTDEAMGEIHQTAAQTLATSAGGVCRGDCDDLAELFQALAQRQGRLGHIMNVPAHAAFAFAEKQPEEGGWAVNVLQTGPPLRFAAATLPEALKLAYKTFGIVDAFDPDQVPVAIRFSGENTRSNWVLSWRIFADADYSATMVDVQRDWHFHTYRRGIDKMTRLIAAGDADPANWRELCGLAESTGQYAEAAGYARKALDAGADPALAVQMRLVSDLYLAEDLDAAKAEARRAAEERLPAAKKDLGPAILGVALDLSWTLLANGKDAALGGLVLNEHVTFPVHRQMASMAMGFQRPRFDREAFLKDPTNQELMRLFVRFVGTTYQVIEKGGPARLASDPNAWNAAAAAELWINNLAFHCVEEPGDIMQRYADVGAYYRAILGPDRLEELFAGVSFPEKAEKDHTRRLPGLGQLWSDLPWIKASVPFWVDQLTRLFERERTTLDRNRVVALSKRVREAFQVSARLGEECPSFEHQLHLVDLIEALVTEDLDALQAKFGEIALRGDKSLRNNASTWVGSVARFLSAEWYGRVLEAWNAELHSKPDVFLIAWAAALNKAPKHALQAAALAVREFPDDPAFAEEHAFMKALFENR